ncbi:putative leucine-rich repeat-containing protein DDB_G0290503 isoform X2 [Mytilus edulis]|uniref:putative leucine-rich repeat-containing protein DDB_G0290503 isoform X2 n=1 Tax=Mytilus edulis TaxID=6550 RepID=UPI0039F0DEA1
MSGENGQDSSDTNRNGESSPQSNIDGDIRRAEELVKEKEKQIEGLKEQIIAAHEKLREVEEKTKSKENDFKTFSDKLKTQESSLKSCNDQLASAKTELNQTTERHKRVADELARLDETHSLNRHLQQMLTKENKTNEKKQLELNAQNVKITSLDADRRQKEEKIKQLTTELRQVRESHEQYKRQIETALGNLQSKLQLQERTIKIKEEDAKSKKMHIDKLQENKQQLEGQIIQLKMDFRQKEMELQKESSEHQQTHLQLVQRFEEVVQLTSQLKSKESELEVLQGEVVKVNVNARELTIRYQELPEKEAQFRKIAESSSYLQEENAELLEQIKVANRLQSVVTNLREQNESYFKDKESFRERNKVMEEKYREILQQYGQQMEESQTFMGQKASLKTQLKQKSDEVNALNNKLKEFFGKVQSLETALVESHRELWEARAHVSPQTVTDNFGIFGNSNANLYNRIIPQNDSGYVENSPSHSRSMEGKRNNNGSL